MQDYTKDCDLSDSCIAHTVLAIVLHTLAWTELVVILISSVILTLTTITNGHFHPQCCSLLAILSFWKHLPKTLEVILALYKTPAEQQQFVLKPSAGLPHLHVGEHEFGATPSISSKKMQQAEDETITAVQQAATC